jgi:hypothetical protein
VDIVEKENHGPRLGQRRQERRELALLPLLRCPGVRPRRRYLRMPRWRARGEQLQERRPRLALQPSVESLEHRQMRFFEREALGTLAGENKRLGADLVEEPRGKCGLSDSRLPSDDRHAALAGRRAPEHPAQLRDLALAPDGRRPFTCRRIGELRHRRNEPVAAARHRDDEAVIVRGLTEGLANGGDLLGEVRLFHDGVGPEAPDQRVPVDHLPRALDEREQASRMPWR